MLHLFISLLLYFKFLFYSSVFTETCDAAYLDQTCVGDDLQTSPGASCAGG